MYIGKFANNSKKISSFLLAILMALLVACSSAAPYNVNDPLSPEQENELSKINLSNENLLAYIFHANTKVADWENIKNKLIEDVDENYVVDPWRAPAMGWKTNGEKAKNPTVVAQIGLNRLFAGGLGIAKMHAQWLIENGIEENSSLFFPFDFDYAPVYPYDFKAPWTSAITQGVALSLFSYLYDATGDEIYRETADKIYRTFLVPVKSGGITLIDDGLPFFEEYPTKESSRVMNGAYSAIFSVNDYGVLCKQPEAIELAKRASLRMDQMITEYDLALAEYPFAISAYSLAPQRELMLFRFVGKKPSFIQKISVSLEKEGASPVLIAKQKLGSEKDENVSNPLYMWYDYDFMNWSKPVSEIFKSGRYINQTIGQYNHSPFHIEMPSDISEYTSLYIDITSDNQDFDIHYYDPIKHEYIPLKLESKTKNTGRYVLNYNGSIHSTVTEKYPYDLRYHDDNQLMTELLGKYTGLENLKAMGEKWKEANILVPPGYQNRAITPIFPKTTNIFELSGYTKVNNPNFYSMNETDYCIVSCEDGGAETLYLYSKTSKDEWVSNGTIFPINSKVGSFSTPYVYEENGLLTMLFAVNGGSKRPGIYLSTSENGVAWSEAKLALNGNYTAPYYANGILYAVLSSAQENELVSFEFAERLAIENKTVLQKRLGNYERIEAVCLAEINDKQFLFLSLLGNENKHFMEIYQVSEEGLIYIESSAQLTDATNQPGHNFHSGIRYDEDGFYFVSSAQTPEEGFLIQRGTLNQNIQKMLNSENAG